ncbi:hypothetical protein LTR10_009409 [Elasticomyces elasticus]|nr:hypothetical protein LTR10_009409 [Elasticomyces elasticus]
MAHHNTAVPQAKRVLHMVPTTASIQPITMQAAHRLFGIAELFDAVMLFQRKPRQLFVNLCVCRAWRNYITRSNALQVHMFLRCGPMTSNSSEIRINPWIMDIVKSLDYRTHRFDADIKMPVPYSPSEQAWEKSTCSLRKSFLVRSRVKDAYLSIIMRVEDVDTTKMVTVKIAEDYNPPLEVVAKMMMDGIAEGNSRIGRYVEAISVYSTKTYNDKVWRGDDKIFGGTRMKVPTEFWAQHIGPDDGERMG